MSLLFFINMSFQISKPGIQTREREREREREGDGELLLVWITFSWLVLMAALQVLSSQPSTASLFNHFPWRLANFQYQSFSLSLKWQPFHIFSNKSIFSQHIFSLFKTWIQAFKPPIFSLSRFFIFNNKLILFLLLQVRV